MSEAFQNLKVLYSTATELEGRIKDEKAITNPAFNYFRIVFK